MRVLGGRHVEAKGCFRAIEGRSGGPPGVVSQADHPFDATSSGPLSGTHSVPQTSGPMSWPTGPADGEPCMRAAALSQVVEPCLPGDVADAGIVKGVPLKHRLGGGAQTGLSKFSPRRAWAGETAVRECCLARAKVPQTRSTMVAVPMPPPVHIVTSPVVRSRRSISSRTVPIRMAPVAPIG